MNNMNVLCLDDNRIHLRILTDIVENDGHTVFPATNPEEAFTLLSENSIDCIVADFELTHVKYDGIDFFNEAVRRGYSHSVIFVTSQSDIFERSVLLEGDVRVVLKTRHCQDELSTNLHNCFAKRLKENSGSYVISSAAPL